MPLSSPTMMNPPDALRALIGRSRIALSLASGQGDMPLTLVNAAFTELTGYAKAEAEGRNCRFLQGADTSAAQIAAMSVFLRNPDQDDGRFPVLNLTRDGRSFTNLVFMSKLRSRDGVLHFVIASQFDAVRARDPALRAVHGAELTDSVTEMRRAADEFGLIMADSSGLIARSITMLARMTVTDE